MMVPLTLLAISLLITGGKPACNIDICLTWEVSNTELKLRCKVNSMRYAVSFENPWHLELGHCSQPVPRSECYVYTLFKNVSISQSSQLTVLKMKGNIDKNVNGPWTCKHGRASDVAVVNVTVLKNVLYNRGFGEEMGCWGKYVSWSLIAYISTFLFFRMVTQCMKLSTRCNKTINRIEQKVYSCNIDIVSKYSAAKATHLVKVCQRIIQMVLVVILIAVALVIGHSDQGNCTGSFGFMLLGALFAVFGLFLMATKADEHDEIETQSTDRRNAETSALQGGDDVTNEDDT